MCGRLFAKMDVTRVTRLVYCPKCRGYIAGDHWGIAPYLCWNCGERYASDMTLIRRAPTELEMSKKYRAAYAHHEARM